MKALNYFILVSTLAAGLVAHAQSEVQPTKNSTQTDQHVTPAENLRASSPRFQNQDRTSFFQVGLGPALSTGLDSDNGMLNIFVSYNRNMGPNWIGKIVGDAYLAGGGDSSRLLSLALGGDYVFSGTGMKSLAPYAGPSIGFGSARNETANVESSPIVGLDGGVKFMAADLNWDLNLQYSLVTDQIEGSNPSVVGLRAGVSF